MALEYEDIDLGQVSEVSGEEFEKVKTSVDFLDLSSMDLMTELKFTPPEDEEGNLLPIGFGISFSGNLYIKKPDDTVEEYYANASKRVNLECAQAGIYQIFCSGYINDLTIDSNGGEDLCINRLANNISILRVENSRDYGGCALYINDTKSLTELTFALGYGYLDFYKDIVLNPRLNTFKVKCENMSVFQESVITISNRITDFEWNIVDIYNAKIIVPYEDIDYYKTKIPEYATCIDAYVLASQQKKLYYHHLCIEIKNAPIYGTVYLYTSILSTNPTEITSEDDMWEHVGGHFDTELASHMPHFPATYADDNGNKGAGVLRFEYDSILFDGIVEDYDTLKLCRRTVPLAGYSSDDINVTDRVIEA